MKIEAVVVCDRYHDFLAETLPYNRSLFSKMVIVTSYEDKETQRICEYWHVQCVKTDVLESRKGIFRKGAGINEGLANLDKDGWVIHMDADIVLPPLTRRLLEMLEMDDTCLYGCDRFMIRNHGDWRKFVEMPRLLHENGSWVHLGAFELGTRVSIEGYGGYIPIGFFQMWHPVGSKITAYPENHDTAARTDMQFALQWKRNKRIFLPELVVYHLESEHAPMASNWSGRATVPFTADKQFRDVEQPVAWYKRKQTQEPTAAADKKEYEG